jgi:curved DNA-binding protein CbpA
VALLRDPYELLDLDRTADLRQVKRAYRRLAKRYHPDAARGDGRAFVALRTAYETLIDPDRRIEWDRRHPSSGYRRRNADEPTGRAPRSTARARANGHGGPSATYDDTAPRTNGRAHRARDQRGRFVRAEAAPWWEEIRGVRSVGVDLPGSRGDPHLGPSSSGAAWSSAARAYFRRLTRQDSASAQRRATAERATSRKA